MLTCGPSRGSCSARDFSLKVALGFRGFLSILLTWRGGRGSGPQMQRRCSPGPHNLGALLKTRHRICQ